MRKNILVGLHTFHHDGSIATYDLDTKEFKYIKFERLTGIKEQYHDDLFSWHQYLEHLGYSLQDNLDVLLVDTSDMFNAMENRSIPQYKRLTLVDHHTCHHYSTSSLNSLVIDDIGSQEDVLSIFKKNKIKEKLEHSTNLSFGRTLNFLWKNWFIGEGHSSKSTYAGHCMALSAFGKDYSNKIGRQFPSTSAERFHDFCDQFKENTYEQNCNNYVSSLHHYWYKRIRNLLKKHFTQKSKIYSSGGVVENIILNTLIKKDFPNYHPTPHCGDEGTSIGALIYGLVKFYNLRFSLDFNKLHQQDENFGYAKEETIKKVAELLHQGKLVMWGQGWGEVGPRALGYRSILMNPCTPNAKQIINDKIKKRIWFRPYGASVSLEDYKKYFDLGFESPWMLYQAVVKDPIKFENITHADGTCRIQTVSDNNPSFLKLLKTFEKISGYPMLINTSMNLPGKPIVGTKKQAKIMFDNSQADALVMGDEILIK